MKRFLLFSIASILGSLSVEAQMYVSPTSYVYVNDQFVFVNQDVNIGNTGNIYLRNQSQLLQGAPSSLNDGAGELSVFQEGTTNNFQYNYWCSPVGRATGGAGNTNFGINLLKRPSVDGDKITSSNITITNGYDGSATNSSLTVSNRWIWKYIASNVYALNSGGWQYVGSNFDVEPGLGFTMKGVSGTDATIADYAENGGAGIANNTGSAQRYDFRGRPNNGDMTALVSNAPGAYYLNLTLVGNPYPSAINLNWYLLENSGFAVDYGTGAISASGTAQIDNTAYFWEHDKSNNTHNVGGYVGGYGTYKPDPSNANVIGTYASAPMSTYDSSGEWNNGTPGSNIGTVVTNTYKRMFAPIGQGFMVHGVVPSGTVTMRNRYRTFVKENTTNSQFERVANSNNQLAIENQYLEDMPNVAGVDYTQFPKASPTPKIALHIKANEAAIYENYIVFSGNTSDDLDFFDGKSPYTAVAKNASLMTNDRAEKLTIASLPFAVEKTVPLYLKCDELTTFKVKLANLNNFDNDVYVHDIVNNTYFNVRNGIYEVTLPAGEYTSQYEITFRDANATLSEDNDVVASSFQVYQNNPQQLLTVFNTLGKDVVSLSLYDMTGKNVISKEKLGTNDRFEIATNALSDGVYVVKVNTADNHSVEKKVSIFK
ncbi:MAG: T9SS type A sorting domain-containing protein [Flavobacteriaceae bacterium]|nr:T9SS type A sorting domain-containing protein [Flavobacteriaceae bacterium]